MSVQKIKRKIKFSVLSVSRQIDDEAIEEDVFTIVKRNITQDSFLTVEVESDKNKVFTLKLNRGINSNFLLGELAIVKKNDLPAVMDLENLDLRELDLNQEEGIYLPIYFILEKKGRFAAIASEFYLNGPQITSIPIFFNTLHKHSNLNFKLNYLVDRNSQRNLDSFERITSLEVRLATKDWKRYNEENPFFDSLDNTIEEINSKLGEINVTLKFTAKRNGSLDKVKEKFTDIKSFFGINDPEKGIKRAKIEGKDQLDSDTYIDLLYDRITVSDEVEVDQSGARRVNKESMYDKLYSALSYNNEFINRTMPNIEIEES